MQEVGVIQDAREIALGQAAQQVHAIALRVGLLSGKVPEALEFALETWWRGGPAPRRPGWRSSACQATTPVGPAVMEFNPWLIPTPALVATRLAGT